MGQTNEQIKECFERDTKNHTMEVLMDNGLYRHLKFTNNGSQCYRFDLITWPGYLAVAGDMGEWMFSRIPDMFDFFIMSEHDFNHKNIINPHYWGEKLQAVDRRGLGNDTRNGYEMFSSDIFDETVREEYDDFIRDNEIDPDCDYAKTLLRALEEEVMGAACDGPYPAYEAAMQFKFDASDWRLESDTRDEDYPEFQMYDFWEHSCTEYNYHYIWICYAIVWGITQYNEFKEKQEQCIS